MELSPRERKSLMSRTHALEPRVRIGGKGLSDAVLAEAEKILSREPLMKVQLPGDREMRHALALELSTRLGAGLVGEVGKIAVLYRPPTETERASDAEGADEDA
ncbi:MAG: YhbY family RNA-binding protein [Planctomycetes bacterium]|nr:YhbY family RNA-binding protein [Planctomycetota bacterium]